MLPRLLCFLTDIERALLADDPAPDNGQWETTRTVNYSLSLSRLCLQVRTEDRSVRPRGIINLQGFTLADGTPCLKAALRWTDSTVETVQSIYTKPGINWTSEARRVAALWMAGAPAVAEVMAADMAPTAAQQVG